MEHTLITGKLLLTDSTHIRANARNDRYETVTIDEEPTAYIRRLNEQAVEERLLPEDYKEKPPTKQKEVKVSTTDPDSGYMHRSSKPNGFYYLCHQTCDGEHGLITDVLVTPGNTSDHSVHSQRIQYQVDKFGFQTEAVCADRGYDSSEIDADMLKRGIKTYIPRKAPNTDAERFQVSDYQYDEETDTYRCPAGFILRFSSYNLKTGRKEYCCSVTNCRGCALRRQCISERSRRKLISRGLNTFAYEKQQENNGTPEYYAALRLRQIWCEGNFSHQKANHNLGQTRKRGLSKATEHCLLSAPAFNLRRMLKLLRGLLPRMILQTISTLQTLVKASATFLPTLSTAPK